MTQPHHHDLSPHEVIPIGSGYNQVSQEMSKKSLDASNFDALTKYTNDVADVEELHIENQKRSSRTIDASLDVKLFPLSAAPRSSHYDVTNSTIVIHRCRVIKRTETVRLKSDFKWEDTKIGDYGTAYFSDIFYGGIMEIEVETRSHESLENLAVKAEISSNNGQIPADAKVTHSNNDSANYKSTSINCRFYGGSLTIIPTSTIDIGKAFSEFIDSVSADSNVVVKRDIRPFPMTGDVMKATGCYNYIKTKREECLPYFFQFPELMKKISDDLDSILHRIKTECIDDMALVFELYSQATEPYPSISKKVGANPKVGIICLGNARTGKSQLLSTSQTHFDPKFAPSGSDTSKTTQQNYTLPNGDNIALVDTPGLYELDPGHLKRNVKEITDGLGMAKHMRICFVARFNSGNINVGDHAAIARISECLASKSYSCGSQSGSENHPIMATVIINMIDEWSMDNYTQEDVTNVYQTIKKSVEHFGGFLVIQQMILVASTNPAILKGKTGRLVEFINATAETNELHIGKLKANQDDISQLTKVLSAEGAGYFGFGAGLIAGEVIEGLVAVGAGTCIAPAFLYYCGGVATIGGSIVGGALLWQHKQQKKRKLAAYESLKQSEIPVYILNASSDFPKLHRRIHVK